MTGANDITKKRCDMCKSPQELASFSKNKSTADGHAKTCRICAKEYAQKYYERNKAKLKKVFSDRYQANKDEYKARTRKWEKENPERKRDLRAKYRAANREKIKEFSKADWAKHNEKRRAQKKEYRVANPERGAEHVRARQTRKQKAMPVWVDRAAIRAIYSECRRLSEATGVKHHVDHFYPLKNPLVCGLHNEYNLRIIPAVENLSKGNRIPI